LPNFSKTCRYTLGGKIDALFLETIEFIFIASYQSKENKGTTLEKSTAKLDLLKFFFQVAWEIKAIDNKNYILISENLFEIGRMLGGWKKQTSAF